MLLVRFLQNWWYRVLDVDFSSFILFHLISWMYLQETLVVQKLGLFDVLLVSFWSVVLSFVHRKTMEDVIFGCYVHLFSGICTCYDLPSVFLFSPFAFSCTFFVFCACYIVYFLWIFHMVFFMVKVVWHVWYLTILCRTVQMIMLLRILKWLTLDFTTTVNFGSLICLMLRILLCMSNKLDRLSELIWMCAFLN